MSERGREQRRRTRLRHGLYTMQRAVAVLGSRALPSKSTALGRELRAWRDSLVADLGGPDAVSTQRLALVDKAVTQKLIVDSLDAYVLGLGSLVNKRHRTLWPVVRERAAQVTLLQSLLRDLGLERRGEQAKDLAALLAELHHQPAPEEVAAAHEERTGGPPPARDRAEPQAAPSSGTDATQACSEGDGSGSGSAKRDGSREHDSSPVGVRSVESVKRGDPSVLSPTPEFSLSGKKSVESVKSPSEEPPDSYPGGVKSVESAERVSPLPDKQDSS